MARLQITEFRDVGRDANGNIVPVYKLNSMISNDVEIGAASAQSAAIGSNTKLLRIHAEADCHIAYGPNPTAVTASGDGSMKLSAGSTIDAEADAGFKIAVIQA